jgi:hypothetical protein
MPLDEFIIRVYCEICEAYAAVASTPLRQRGFAPALSDEEVLTMEIVGAYLGMSQDMQIWSYFHRHWRDWFPGLGARSTFVRQSANLWALKQCMHRHWVRRLGACKGAVHLIDGFPVPVCHFRRAHFSQVFRGEATFGYCASKQQTYYGFKAMVLTSGEGVIQDIALFAAHVDERDALVDMDLSAIQGMLLGDKGFIRPILKEDLVRQGIDLHTPLRSNMKENRPRGFMRQAAHARRLVETVIGQLCERFEIERNRARDLWHLVSRLYRKVAAHTLCVLLNRQLGRPCLHLDGLVSG